MQNYRVKITGTYRGQSWEYIDSPDGEGSAFVYAPGEYFGNEEWLPGDYWFSEGNFSCDCNRGRFVFGDKYDCDNAQCGREINIDRIEPIEQPIPGVVLPPIVLDETINGH